MAALGDKIGSTILAQAAGVPTIPWSGSGVAVDYASCNGEIPADVYARACVHSVDEALESCRRIGYPIMLKASWGGGGKGIRKAREREGWEQSGACEGRGPGRAGPARGVHRAAPCQGCATPTCPHPLLPHVPSA